MKVPGRSPGSRRADVYRQEGSAFPVLNRHVNAVVSDPVAAGKSAGLGLSKTHAHSSGGCGGFSAFPFHPVRRATRPPGHPERYAKTIAERRRATSVMEVVRSAPSG